MGAAVPQVVCATESGASGAQVIDGSLKFDRASQNYLSRTFSLGNRRTWTWSCWVQPHKQTVVLPFLANTTGSNSDTEYNGFFFNADQTLGFNGWNTQFRKTTAKHRDTGWYHIVVAFDTTQGTALDRLKYYVNGVLQTDFASNNAFTQNGQYAFNKAETHHLGRLTGDYADSRFSQVYFIDGQQLDASYFGYTDGLTNTWRPKKYTGEFNFTVGTTNYTSISTLAALAGSTLNGSYNDVSKVFDGSGTGVRTVEETSNQGEKLSITFSPAITLSNQTVSIDTYSTYQGMFVTVGGADGSRVSGSDSNTTTLTTGSLSGSLSKITVDNGTDTSGRGASILRIRIGGSTLLNPVIGVNGFYLPMDGNSPIGHDKSNPNPVNNGTTWSSGTVNGTPYNATYTWEKAFDGNLTGTGAAGGVNTANQFNLALPNIDITGKNVTIYGNSNSADVWLNGTQLFMTSGTVYSGSVYQKSFTSSDIGSTTLTQIGLDAGLTVYGVAIDGVILIDGMYGNGWTPVNFGGSVALPKATGALPILNTDGGGNVARPGVFGSEVGAYYAVTVASVGGGNRYHFDGVDRPNPTLTRGATYTFDQSDSTNSNHPLRFSTTSNGSHGGGSEYTDGVAYYINGSVVSGSDYVSNYSHNSADTLYYYCTNHSNMGSSTSQITDETKADLYAWKNVLALPLVGSDSDVSNSVNSGSTTNTITNSGVDFVSTYSNFYRGSADFTGASTDVLNTASDNTKYQMGTGDFTVECWVYSTSTSGTQNIFQVFKSSGSKYYGVYYSSTLRFQIAGSGGTEVNVGNIVMGENRWRHIAMVRDGGTLRAFVDGVQVGSGSVTSNINEDGYVAYIGRHQPSNNGLTGYMQDFRIYKGVAKYTSNFVVPATSPDILPDTPSGVSGSSKLAKVTDGAVHFDGTGDYLNIGSSTDYTFGTGDYTIEMFVYHTSISGQQTYFSDPVGNSAGVYFYKNSSQKLALYYSGQIATGNTDIASNKWTHVAISRTGGTSRLFQDGILVGSGSDTTDLTATQYYIADSASSSGEMFGYISNVRVIKGTALYTSSFTPPTRTLTNVTNTKLLCCQSNTSATEGAVKPGTITIPNPGYEFSTAKSYSVYQDAARGANYTVQYSDDNSNWTTAWTGVMTANSECGIINGTGGGSSYGRHNYWRYVEGSATQGHHPRVSRIILRTTGGTDVNIKVYTSDNCSDSGTYQVNTVTYTDSTYGTATNQAAPTTFNPFTTDINAVRGQETGYATLNPLNNITEATFADGNLKVTTKNASSHYGTHTSTLSMSSGKYYAEVTVESTQGYPTFGVCDVKSAFTDTSWIGSLNPAISYYGNNGKKYVNGAAAATYGSSFGAGNTIGISVDLDGLTVEFFKDGVSQGVITGLTDDIEYFFGGSEFDTGSGVFLWNYGQKPFKFPPPAGFQPLNGANVRPETVITRPDHYVGATLYTGNGGTQSINVGLKPDFVWIKDRTNTGFHSLFDTVRGATKTIFSNATNAEETQSGGVTAFNSDGFSLGSWSIVNAARTYVAWTWKAGGNKNTFNKDDVGYASAAAAGLTGGSTNPNGASVGTKQGFSIIKWTGTGSGTSLGHGLGSAPDFVMVKSLANSREWLVWHSSFGTASNTDYLYLNTTGSKGGSGAGDYWNNTAPTSTTFSVGNSAAVNSGGDFIAYLWHDVPGLQKFGKYTGNGNADGPFIELGFRPAVLLTKRIDGGSNNWQIIDAKRSPHNVANTILKPDESSAETSHADYATDFLSNGFKHRTGHVARNGSGNTYIYAAWAEAPTFNLFGAQSNAR